MGSVLRRLLFFFQRNAVRSGSGRRAALSRGDEGARPRRRGWHERRRGAGGRAAADWQSAAAARTIERTVDLRDGRNVRAGRASHAAIDAARSGVHLHRPRHARARHRPQHRDFLRRLRRALASAAVSESRSTGHDLVSAADRERPQDVLDLGARVVRGAAPAGRHAR